MGSEADFYSLSNELYRNNHPTKKPRQKNIGVAFWCQLMHGDNHPIKLFKRIVQSFQAPGGCPQIYTTHRNGHADPT